MVKRLWGLRSWGPIGPQGGAMGTNMAPLGPPKHSGLERDLWAQWAPKRGTKAVGGAMVGPPWGSNGEHRAPRGAALGPLGALGHNAST